VLKGGFHPKVIAWKTHSGEHYCLIGSSNLSKAAFSDNHEANVLAKVSADEFRELCDWIDSIVENHAVPASKDYIENHYIETKLAGGKAKHNRPFSSSCSFRVGPPAARRYKVDVASKRGSIR
jgi:hypothetical protein